MLHVLFDILIKPVRIWVAVKIIIIISIMTFCFLEAGIRNILKIVRKFVVHVQRQSLSVVFFGKLCGTASAQNSKLCSRVQ